MDVSKEYGKKLLSANDEFQSPQWGNSKVSMKQYYLATASFSPHNGDIVLKKWKNCT